MTMTIAGETYTTADIIAACRRTIAHQTDLAAQFASRGDQHMERACLRTVERTRAHLATLVAEEAR